MFTLVSSTFSVNGRIPSRCSKDGGNVLPGLRWSGAPVETLGFAVMVADPDTPRGTVWHLAVYNVPATVVGFTEGEDLSAYPSCENYFGEKGWGGPRPPKGKPPHHYHFSVFALSDARLPLVSSASVDDLTEAIRSRLLAKATLIGRYATSGSPQAVRE